MADEKTQEQERSDIHIEGNVGVWNINVNGSINGTYIGTFRFKGFLTPTEQISADRERRELLGSSQPTMIPEHESFLAYALTQLKYRIVSAPPFWSAAKNGSIEGDLPDENVITAVLDAALGTEIKYRNQLNAKKVDALKRAIAAAENAMKTDEEDDQKDQDNEEEQE